jgi:hypothetical protein
VATEIKRLLDGLVSGMRRTMPLAAPHTNEPLAISQCWILEAFVPEGSGEFQRFISFLN